VRVIKFLGTEKFVKDKHLETVKQKLTDILTHYKTKKRIDKSPVRRKTAASIKK
jgi:hypothetical protein